LREREREVESIAEEKAGVKSHGRRSTRENEVKYSRRVGGTEKSWKKEHKRGIYIYISSSYI
jgi:hypothetical protein